MKTKTTFFKLTLLIAFAIMQQSSSGQPPEIQWQKSFGGSNSDVATSVQQTHDGGFVIAGFSFSDDGNVTGDLGQSDYWIVNIDSNGNLLWEKSFGGTGIDEARCIRQTADGGFVVAGSSNSVDGNVTGNHGGYDYWIIRLDANGALLWEKSLGGSQDDDATAAQPTFDGGFIISGLSYSDDGDVSVNHGLEDYWIVRMDGTGNLIWEKSLGGTQHDQSYSVIQTFDGGFVVAGLSSSTDADVTGNHGDYDCWLAKLDPSGSLMWQKCFGGSEFDVARCILQTGDDGFIISGSSKSNDGDVPSNYGSTDVWIMQLDLAGNIVWKKSFGGSAYDEASSIQHTSDGGYIICGSTASDDHDVSGNHGGYADYWIMKLDHNGEKVWQKCLGGSSSDWSHEIIPTSDGGFVVAGDASSNNGDVTGNHGNADFWIVKLFTGVPSMITESESTDFGVSVFPNPISTSAAFMFSISNSGRVSVIIYNESGKQIRILADENMNCGNHQLQWNADDENGNGVMNGMYFMRITTLENSETIPLSVIR